MKCYTAPYEGEQDFLFFSYCHDDAARVYPIIERLTLEGFRVWYDDGIHPGEDWPQVIAEHLSRAKSCVAAVSSASAESHNCRNEITFAVTENKPLLSIILEEFQMPIGMKLQLGSARYVKKYELTEEAFYDALLAAPALDTCRNANSGVNQAALEVWRRHAEEYKDKKSGTPNSQTDSSNKRHVINKSWFERRHDFSEEAHEKADAEEEARRKAAEEEAQRKAAEEEARRKAAEEEAQRKAAEEEAQRKAAEEEARRKAAEEEAQRKAAEEEARRKAAEEEARRKAVEEEAQRKAAEEEAQRKAVKTHDGEDAVTRLEIKDDSKASDEDDNKTIYKSGKGTDGQTRLRVSYNPALFMRMKTGEIYPIKKGETVIGRKAEKADIAFPDNDEISGEHVKILRKEKTYLLQNLNPTNETIIDGVELAKDDEVELSNCAGIVLAGEQFFLISGDAYARVFDERKICFIVCEKTGETRILSENLLQLDRHHKWRENILGDQRIHRAGHAEIYHEHGAFYLRDLGSHHGTFLNGKRLDPKVGAELHDGDIIAVVETEFAYHESRIGG